MKSNFNLPILLKKEVLSDFFFEIFSIYGAKTVSLNDYYFYEVKINNNIYISKNKLDEVNEKLFYQAGFLFAKFFSFDDFYLTLEATKLIDVSKNFVILKQNALNKYLSGKNLVKEDLDEIDIDGSSDFIIVKFKGENLGSVKILDVGFENLLPRSKLIDEGKLF